MSWRGFVLESKSYMNYPGLWQGYWAESNEQLFLDDGTLDERYPGWTPEERKRETIAFWKKFPRAWIIFYSCQIYDKFYRSSSVRRLVGRFI